MVKLRDWGKARGAKRGAVAALFLAALGCTSGANIPSAPPPTPAEPAPSKPEPKSDKLRFVVHLTRAFEGVPAPTGEIPITCGKDCSATWSTAMPALIEVDSHLLPLEIRVGGEYIAAPMKLQKPQQELSLGVLPIMRDIPLARGNLLLFPATIGGDSIENWFAEPTVQGMHASNLPTRSKERGELLYRHSVDGNLRVIFEVNPKVDFQKLFRFAEVLSEEYRARGGQKLQFVATVRRERLALADRKQGTDGSPDPQQPATGDSDSRAAALEKADRDFGSAGLLGGGRLPYTSHRTPQPKIRVGATSVNGRLPAEVVRRVVRQNFGRFQICYEKPLRKNPKLGGQLLARFRIERDGTVGEVRNGGSDLPDEEMVSCVLRTFRGLYFPAPEGGVVYVSYPIKFSPPEPSTP